MQGIRQLARVSQADLNATATDEPVARKPRGVTITIRMPLETYAPVAEMLKTEIGKIPQVESVEVTLDDDPEAAAELIRKAFELPAPRPRDG